LFVVDERKLGGASIVLENIFKVFPKKQFDLLVLNNIGDRLESENVNMFFGPKVFRTCHKSLIECIKSRKVNDIFNKLFLIFLMKSGLISKVINRERKKMNLKSYDVEISFKDGFGTFFVAYGDSKKKIRWLHSDYSINNPGKNYKKTFKDALYRFDKIVGISNGVLDKFNEKYHLESKSTVIYNIININKFSANRTKKNDNKLIFVTVGRLSKVKGYDRVILVLSRLKQENKLNNLIFKIVGNGPERKKLEKMVKKLGLSQTVSFLGESKRPWDKISNGDLFIMSSYHEAYPTTVIESLINSIPVFSVKYSSVGEMLDESNSIVVENSEEAIYVGLKSVIEGKYDLKKMKEQLKEYEYNNNEKSIVQLNELWR